MAKNIFVTSFIDGLTLISIDLVVAAAPKLNAAMAHEVDEESTITENIF